MGIQSVCDGNYNWQYLGVSTNGGIDMVKGTPNKEWSEKISGIGLKGKAKIHNGDPFRGVWQGGTFKKDNPRERSARSDMFGSEEWEWRICEEMVDLRRDGKTYGQIAQWLNDKDIKTKAGRAWNYFTARFVTLRTVQLQRLADSDSTLRTVPYARSSN